MIQVFVFKAVTPYLCLGRKRPHFSRNFLAILSEKTTTTLGQRLLLQISMAVAQNVLSCLPRQIFFCAY